MVNKHMKMNENNQNTESEDKHFSYFCNTQCEYFPCHKINASEFNCLFCYCPLYVFKDCGGNYTYLENGVKDCSACVLPHKRENYKLILERLQERLSAENN